MTPVVSVLMTVYNAAPYLARSLDSVCRQTLASWELICVENGSTDDSAKILDSFSDARIRRIALTANIGRTPALRQAFEHARGRYVAVLDADDICAPDRLEKQVGFLDAHPGVVLVGTWARFIDACDGVTGEWTPPADSASLRVLLASENPIVHSSAMYRADAARQVGGYPLDAAFGQDLALWLNLLTVGEPAVLPEFLCSFRVLPGSMTRGATWRVAAAHDKLKLLLKAGAQAPRVPEARRRNREELAIARLRYAIALARSGQALKGLAAAAAALYHDPVRVLNNRITRALLKSPR